MRGPETAAYAAVPTIAEVEDVVRTWVAARDEHRTRSERTDARRLRAIVSDENSTAFVAAFLDRTARPEHQRTAAQQLAGVVADVPTGTFLSPLDRLLLKAGRVLAPLLPSVVMPLAERRLRQIVGHLIAPAEPDALRRHMTSLASPNRRLNVNLLGEAVLGDAEAGRRFDSLAAILSQPDVDYVSVKLSSVVGRVSEWDHERSVDRLAERLGELLDRAAVTEPRTFVNVDMEEYAELDVTGHLGTDVAPLIGTPNSRLRRAFVNTAESEWLVRPMTDPHLPNLWSPGGLDNVAPESWFHRTECFGPVLGLMHAKTLDEAIDLANASDFALTSGVHTLDPDEAAHWLQRIEAGNAYINRSITGAIVQRQPFGGWKRSAVGPGAKAGGPNYVAQLRFWADSFAGAGHHEPREDYESQWANHFAIDHDPSGLSTESNVFRYLPLPATVLRREHDADERHVRLARRAASICGVQLIESGPDETVADLAARLPELHAEGVARIRIVGTTTNAHDELRLIAHRIGVAILDDPVLAAGRIDLTRWCREQSVSQTMHRFGSTLGQQRAVDRVLPPGRAAGPATVTSKMP